MMRRLLLLVALLLGGVRPAAAQQPVARFEITAVTDSTLSFRAGPVGWLRSGQAGIAVDPRRRDQMVARFRVVSVGGGIAQAVITGQVTDVSTDHIATLTVPATPWYRRRSFWVGLVLGGVLGAAGASAT